MDLLILIVIIIAVIMAIILIVPLFVKKDYTIQREIIIDKPRQEVFDYVKFLKNQDYFSKWVMTDPDMKKEFRGKDGTVGFVYAWDGNKKAGKGEQEITGIKEGERLDIEVRFVKPFESTANTPMTTERVAENQTKVTWGMNGKSKYPYNLINLFMDSMLGKDLETSLITLKNKLEKR
jgi:uncharacterized protein YndB with AHSA1/START domain